MIRRQSLLLAAALLAASSAVRAQESYELREETGGFEDLRSLGAPLPLTADRAGAAVPLGFTFRFYGVDQTSVGVTTEGYLTFGGAVTNTPGALPSPVAPNAVIAPLWANLDITRFAGAKVHAKTLGSGPSRRFVVQWSDLPLAADHAARLTFQAVLFEGTGAIELRYLSLRNGDGTTGGAAGGGTATIGIEDASGAQGVLHARNVPGAIRDGLRLIIERAPARTPTIAVRSAVAGPGMEVVVPIDVNRLVDGLRGFRATLVAVPEGSDLPPLAVRALRRGATAPVGSTAYATNRDLATTGPLRLVLPVNRPVSDEVPSQDGPLTIGEVVLVVPRDAVPSSSYRLELQTVEGAGKTGTLPVAAGVGRLTIGEPGVATTVDRLEIVATRRLAVGAPGQVEVVATGGGAPVPGVLIGFFVDNAQALGLGSPGGTTGPDGRFRTTLAGTAPGLARVVGSSAGLSDAVASVAVVDATPPRIVSTPPTLATVASLYAYNVLLSPAGSAAFDLESAPDGMTISPTGELRWVPGPDQLGAHTVTVRVVDHPTRQTFAVLVEAVPLVPRPNQRPTITTTPPATSLVVGQTFTYDVNANDPDAGDVLTFSKGVAPAGVLVDPATGVVTFTPGPGDVGQPRALILVTDGRGGLDGQGLVFTVTPPTTDQPPVITSTPPMTAPIGEEYRYQVVAVDPEAQPVTYRIAAGPTGMTIDPATGEIKWIPAWPADLYVAPQQAVVGAETLLTLGGDVAGVAHGRFEDPPGFVLGKLIYFGSGGAYGTGFPLSYGWTGPTVAGPGGLLQGYGDERDFLWVQHTGANAAIEGVPGGLPSTGLTYDLQGEANKVVVFPLIDHGPLPYEALEHTVYLSDDRITWERAKLETVYEQGWHPDPAYIADGFVGVYSLPNGRTSRYASVVWGGPAAMFADFDNEIDAVAGLQANGAGVGAPSNSTVIVEVVDAAGNVTRQQFTLDVPGVAAPDACPDALDFGDVPVGERVRRQVLIDNTGTMPVAVRRAEVLGAQAPYHADLLTIDGEVVVDVEFAPTSVGEVTSAVYVTLGEGSLTVPVWGAGVDPATHGGRPRIVSTPSLLAIVGREYAYTIRAESAGGGALTYSLFEGPEGLRVHPTSGALRWTPTAEQATDHQVEIQVTDAEGHVARQRWCLVAVRVDLSVAVEPVRAPQGVNDFRVSIRVNVEPPRLVEGPRGAVDRLVLEHVVPPGFALVPKTSNVPIADQNVVAEGTVVSWKLPLTGLFVKFDVRSTELPLGQHPASVETRARLLVTGEASASDFWTLARTLTVTDPFGLGVDRASGRLIVANPTGDRLDELESASGAITSTLAVVGGQHDVEVALVTSHYLVVDIESNRLRELRRTDGGQVRTTRTDGFGSNLRGFALDPDTGRKYFTSPTTGLLYRHERWFGEHLPSGSVNAQDAVVGSGSLWTVRHSPAAVVRHDPATGAELSSFPVPGANPYGVAFDPVRQELHVLSNDPDVVRTYSIGGELLRSTRADGQGATPFGFDRDPTTGEYLLVDANARRIQRIDATFTRHIPAPGQPHGVTYDASSDTLWFVSLSPRRAYRVDKTTGAVLRQFDLISTANPYGAAFDPDRQELHVLSNDPDQVDTYTTDGVYLRTTSVAHYGATPFGFDRDPATGEYLLADQNAKTVHRIGSTFTRHVPAPGQPHGVTHDSSSDTLWSVSLSPRRAYQLNKTTGAVLRQFDLISTANPYGAAFDPDRQELHVLSNDPDQVDTYSAAGTYLRTTRTDFGATPFGLDRDQATGEYLFADQNARLVHRIAATFTRHIPSPGQPHGVTYDPSSGTLWSVSLSPRRAFQLNKTSGEVLRQFDLIPTANPYGAAFDPDRQELHVLSNDPDQVDTYSAFGTYLRTTRTDFGLTPFGLDRDHATGEYLFADQNAKLVHRIAATFTRHIPSPGQPHGVTYDPSSGALWSVSLSPRRAFQLDKTTGAVLRQFDLSSTANPYGAAFDPTRQELHVLSNDPDQVDTYSATGTYLRTTRTDFGATPFGLDRDQATGEYLFADQNAKLVHRIAATFTRHIPSPGQPHGVTYDPSSDALWSVSLSPRRAFQLDKTTGAVLRQFDLSSSANPYGAAFDPDRQELHVLSNDPDQVDTYSATGTYLRTTRTDFGATPFGLDRDQATGEYLFADQNAKLVHRVASTFTRHIPAPGTPHGVTYDPSSDTLWYVGHSPRRAYQVDKATGAVQRQFDLGSSLNPYGAAFDPDRQELHVLSNDPDRLYTYSTSGALLRSTSVSHYGATPFGLDRDPSTGELVLADQNAKRVRRLSPGFTRHTSLLGFPVPATFAVGVACVSSASVWVADLGAARVHRLDATGASVQSFPVISTVYGLALDPATGDLLVVGNDRRIVRYSTSGTLLGTTSLPFGSTPSGLVVVGSGPSTRWFVSDQGTRAVYEIDPAAPSSPIRTFSTSTYSATPQDVALAADGVNLVVLDQSGLVQPIDRLTGLPIGGAFTCAASGASSTAGICFDGTTYRVADFSEDELFAIAPGGDDLGSFATGTPNPYGITIGPGGDVFVSDVSTQAVHRFTRTGDALGSFPTKKFGAFEPDGLAWDGTNLFVCDAGVGRIFEVPPGGMVTSAFATGTPNPYGVSAGPDGDVFVSDISNQAVYRFTRTGTLVGSFPTKKFGAFEPDGLAWDGTNVFVCDAGVGRIFEVPPGGMATSSFPTNTPNPYGVSAGPDGDVFVSDISNQAVYRFTRTGALVGSFPTKKFGAFEPDGLAWDGTNVFVCDSGVGRIFEVPPGGMVTSAFGTGTPNPYGVSAGPDGDVFVSDISNQAVYRFTRAGALIGSFPTKKFGAFEPDGLAWDGTNVFVCDAGVGRIFEVPPGGMVTSSFPTNTPNPYGVSAGPGGDVFVSDISNQAVYRFTRTGTLVGSFSSRAYGSLNPTGLAFDGSSVFVADASAARIFEVGVAGMTPHSFPTNTPNPYGITAGPDGDVLVSDVSTLAVHRYRRDGTPVSSFDTRAFGSFSPSGLAFDGATIYVADPVEARLFQVPAAGFTTSSFSTTTLGSSNPQDVAAHPCGETVFFVDGSTAQLIEATRAGVLVARHDLRELGSYAPTGLGRDAGGGLLVTDSADGGRIFPLGVCGTGLKRYDLAANEIEQIDGLAWDPVDGTLWLHNDTTVWEAEVDDRRLDRIGTLELSLFPNIGAADDVAVDRLRGQVYVSSAASDRVYAFEIPDTAKGIPARIALVGDGSTAGYALALRKRGHTVVESALAPGAVAAALADPHVSQLWLVGGQGASSGAVLTEADLAALDAWRASTERTHVVLDGLGGRGHEVLEQRRYTQRIARGLERAGGGLVLAAPPEVAPIAAPPDGTGPGLASITQVTDRLGYGRVAGAYQTFAVRPAMGATFDPNPLGFDLVGEEADCRCRPPTPTGAPRLDVLFGRGDVFEQIPVLDADGLIGTAGSLVHPELPTGVQPGGAELFPALEAAYELTGPGSPELADRRAHVLATTIASTTSPEAVVGPVLVEIVPIVTIVPLAGTVVPGGTTVFAVNVENPVGREATYDLSLLGLPADFTGALAETRLVVPAGGTRTTLATLGASVATVETTLPFQVAAVERFEDRNGVLLEVRGRGQATATLSVIDALQLGLTATPALQSVRGGDLATVTLRATNPRLEPRRLQLELLGLAPLGASIDAVEVDVPASGSVDVPFAFPIGQDVLPGDVLVTGLVRAVTDLGLAPAAASITISVLPPNTPPVALAGLDRSLPASVLVNPFGLDGRGSYDEDGDPLTYIWTSASGLTYVGATPAVLLTSGSQLFTLVVSDGLASSAPDTVLVTVGDTTPPSVGPFPDVTVEQSALAGTPVSFPLVVSDDDGLGLSVVATPASGADFPLGVSMVALVASDGTGNVATASFLVRVVDTTAPVFSALPMVEVELQNPLGGPVTFPTPAVNDVCDAAPFVTCTPPSGAHFPQGDTVVLCTATDSSGNVGVASFVVRVTPPRDVTPPTIQILAPAPDGVLLATRAVGVELSYADDPDGTGVDPATLVVLADGQDVSALFASTATAGSASATLPFAADGAHELVATVRDRRANTSPAARRVFVVDTTPPVITAADLTVEQAAFAGTPAVVPASVADALDPAPTLESNAPAVFPLGATTVTFTARDRTGNVATRQVTVLVRDTTAPTLNAPADLTVEQTALGGTPVDFGATVTDVCDAAPTLTFSTGSGAVFPLGATLVTVTAADASGNVATRTFTVRVVDTTAPFLTVPPVDVTLEATGPGGAVAAYPPIGAGDACDATPVVECNPPPGSLLPLGVTTVQCEASDVSGNARAFSFTVRVVDTTPPALVVPADLTVEQSSRDGAVVSWSAPTATDVVDPSPLVTASATPGGLFPLGTTVVTVTARDAAGNVSTSTSRVSVVDTTAPALLGVSGNLVVNATGPTGAVVVYPTPTASDVCDAAPVVVCAPASGSLFPLGETTVTCTATDASGNSWSETFVVSVRVVPLLFADPPDLTVEQATAAGTAVTYDVPPASGGVAPVTVVCVPPPGTVFPLGVSLVECTATDAAGTARTQTFLVTVVDTTPPALAAAPDVAVLATGPAGAVVTFATPAASDVCDAAPVVLCAPASGSQFPIGETTVTCTATDASGNVATRTFVVSVGASTLVLADPDDVTLEQATAAGTALTYTAPLATGGVPPVSVTCTPVAGTVFPLGATTVTCTATDAVGTTKSQTFVVSIVDTTPPVLATTSAVVALATSPAGAVVTYATPAASDVCDAAPAVVCAPPAGTTFPIGATTVTCTATDASGNVATRTFVVTVEAPALVLADPPDVTVEQATAAGTAVAYAPPVATGGVPPLSVVCTPAPGTVFPLGVTTVECTATDALGATNRQTFLVSVVDTTPPALGAAPDVTAEATGASGAVVTYAAPAAVDVCDAAPVVVCAPPSGGQFPIGATTVTCTATDASGNVASRTFVVRVEAAALVLADPADVAAEQATRAGTLVSYGAPVATGGVPPVTVTSSPAPGTVFPLGATTVTCTATDALGTTSTQAFLVNVVDTTPPALATTNVSALATGASGAVVTYPAPEVSDVCDAAPVVVSSPASGSLFPIGETTVTCTATDASGNVATATFVVTVGASTLVLADPDDVTVEQATRAGTAVPFATPAATGGVPPVTVICAPAAGTVFPLGATTVTCTATDAVGTTRTQSFVVSVVDTTPPVLAAAADVTAAPNSVSGAVVTFATPGASDVCDAAPVVACSPASGATFPIGQTTVTCTATDASGNVATRTFVVRVVPAELTVAASPDVSVEQATRAGTAVSYALPAVTGGVPPVGLTCTPSPGFVFPLGATTVTCTATDAVGTTRSRTFVVTVVDTAPPTLTAPTSRTLEQTGLAGTPTSYTATATDVCDAAPTVVLTPPSGTVFPLGATTVTARATDVSGNVATRTFVVTVVDTTPPATSSPADLTIASPSGSGVPRSDPAVQAWLATFTATDVCDAAPRRESDAPATFPVGVTVVTFRATDASGNVATRTARVTVTSATVTIRITAPDDGSCHAGPVTVVTVVTPAGASVTLSGTRTKSGSTTSAGAGPTYTSQGDYVITARAGSASATVRFTIDATAPVVAIQSPVANPHPEVAYPRSKYRVVACCTSPSNDCEDDHEQGCGHGCGNGGCDHRHDDGCGDRDHDDRCGGRDHDDRCGDSGHRQCGHSHDDRCGGRSSGNGCDDDRDDEHGCTHRHDDRCGGNDRGGCGDDRGGCGHEHDDRCGGRDDDRGHDCRHDHDDRCGGRDDDDRCDHDCGRDDCDDGPACPADDLPIDLRHTATDDDGISGGVVRVERRLDGLLLGASVTKLDAAAFETLGLPVLGRHTFEVVAFDCAGNSGRASVAFELVLVGVEGSGLLTVKAESLNGNGGVMTVFFELPCPPTGSPLDPTVSDVVHSSLKLTATRTGRIASVDKVTSDNGGRRLVIKFRRSDLDDDGELGDHFVLTGRFGSATGPAFWAEDEVKHDH